MKKLKIVNDGEWWKVEMKTGDVRVARFWLRDGDSDAVWNVFEGESLSVFSADECTPICKMIDESHSYCNRDLKPRTRTEYEKVTESIFDLRDEFERGELYWWYESDCKDKSEFVGIRSEYDLSTYFAKGNIFKRVEKEIDWHSELGSYLNKPSINGFEEELPTRVCIYLNGIEFHLTDSEYLESCRVALRANGEIE